MLALLAFDVYRKTMSGCRALWQGYTVSSVPVSCSTERSCSWRRSITHSSRLQGFSEGSRLKLSKIFKEGFPYLRFLDIVVVGVSSRKEKGKLLLVLSKGEKKAYEHGRDAEAYAEGRETPWRTIYQQLASLQHWLYICSTSAHPCRRSWTDFPR